MAEHRILDKAKKLLNPPKQKFSDADLKKHDPLALARKQNQIAENKLRKLRIKNRIKRGGPGSQDLGDPRERGLRKRVK
jgi:hypothetical protein